MNIMEATKEGSRAFVTLFNGKKIIAGCSIEGLHLKYEDDSLVPPSLYKVLLEDEHWEPYPAILNKNKGVEALLTGKTLVIKGDPTLTMKMSEGMVIMQRSYSLDNAADNIRWDTWEIK